MNEIEEKINKAKQDTSIKITQDAYDSLLEIKRGRDTFSDVITRLVISYKETLQGDLLRQASNLRCIRDFLADNPDADEEWISELDTAIKKLEQQCC